MNNFVVIFTCGLFSLLSSADSASFLHTNIGKFIDNVQSRLQNHTLSVPNATDLKIDRNILESAFHGFRNVMDDPLDIMEQKLNYEMKNIIKIYGNVKSLRVEGFKKMLLEHVYISEDNLNSSFIIRMPTLEISGLYNSSCYLEEYNFDIYGNGSFKWTIMDLRLKVNFTLSKMQTEFIQLKKIYFDQSIGNSKFEIKNLLNDEAVSSVISDIISIIIPPLHNYFKPAMNQFIASTLGLYSEILFSNMKAKDFVGIIYAFKEKATSENTLGSTIVA